MHKKTDRYRQPLYIRSELRFECTACGACCTGDETHHVFITSDEARKICASLGLTWPWFRRRYISTLQDVGLVLNSTDEGRCVFLDELDKCRIYKVRPRQCSSYPFWDEVVKTSKGWRREARRCEGIGRGPVIPVHVIEAELEHDA